MKSISNPPARIKRMGHPRMKWGTVMRVLGLLLWAPLAAQAADNYQHRVEQVLLRTPLIDGHNDLPWEIRDRFKSDLAAVDLASDTTHLPFPAGADHAGENLFGQAYGGPVSRRSGNGVHGSRCAAHPPLAQGCLDDRHR